MCVLLVGFKQIVPWCQKHARYLNGLEQSQSWWCKNTHRTQCSTHQWSPRLKVLMIMLPDGDNEGGVNTACFSDFAIS